MASENGLASSTRLVNEPLDNSRTLSKQQRQAALDELEESFWVLQPVKGCVRLSST